MKSIGQWRTNLQKNDMWLVIHTIFKNSFTTYLLTTCYAPSTSGIVIEIHRLFIREENLIKQPQTEV